MEVIIKDGVKYKRDTFLLEKDFEKIVLSQYKHIFGENSILFDKRIIHTVSGIGTIPDAFILCPSVNKWYIVEVELAGHSVYGHIIPQISKFRTALKNNRSKLTRFFDDEITKDSLKTAHWHIATNSTNSIHRAVSELVDTAPEIIVVIDDENKELKDALSDPAYQNVHLRLFKSFNRSETSSTDSIYLFDSIDQPVTRTNRLNHTINSSSVPNVPVIETAAESTINSSQTIGVANSSYANVRTKNSSPSPSDWTALVPELQGINNLKNWKSICDHFSIDYGVDSARRVLKKWVLNNRPDLPPVP